MENSRAPGITREKAGLILLAGLLLVCTGISVVQFRSRFFFQTGISHMNQAAYDSALAGFEKAGTAIPGFLAATVARQDLFRIYTRTGITLQNQALALWKENRPMETVTRLYDQSRIILEKAVAIDGAAYVPAYWLARAYTALQVVHGSRFPDRPNPYDAGPLYERAVALRPNGITVLYARARYQDHIKDRAGLMKTVRHMTRIYPPAYHSLKREGFFSPDLMSEMKAGLEAAVAEQVDPKSALAALSDIHETAGEFGSAADRYEQSLALQPFTNTDSHYLNMGRLTLLAGRPDDSRDWFVKTLETAGDFDSALARIHAVHRRAGNLDAFIRFGVALEKKGHWPPALDLEIAAAWMEQEQYLFARTRLNRLNDRQPSAPAHYLLARMADAEKNWDEVERHAQKAAALDPENSRYYYLLARALNHQKKYGSAEEMATRALARVQKPDPWLFNLRAWTRWHQKQYFSAMVDWKRALDLDPGRADFAYQIARACEQEGMFDQGLAYVQKALALDPDRKAFQDLATRLRRYQ